jgi:hypothetical protein
MSESKKEKKPVTIGTSYEYRILRKSGSTGTLVLEKETDIDSLDPDINKKLDLFFKQMSNMQEYMIKQQEQTLK